MSKVILFVVVGLGLLGFAFLNISSDSSDKPIVTNSSSNYQISPVDIPLEISFAGEKVPLHNFDIYESIDKELLINTYWQSQTLLFIKRANRFFPIIEPIFKEYGIPSDLKYLAIAESGLENVVSPAKAAGYWQFLPRTAREYGLTVTSQVDERYHIEKSTEAAAKFLKKSYAKFGSWTLAAAAYNMGRRNIIKQIDRQKSDSYFDLVLGPETGRYVYRLIAFKLIFESPEKYGFFVEENQKYQPLKYSTITIDSTIYDLADFAHDKGINYKVLKELNPWLRTNKLINSKNVPYEIKIADVKQRQVVVSS